MKPPSTVASTAEGVFLFAATLSFLLDFDVLGIIHVGTRVRLGNGRAAATLEGLQMSGNAVGTVIITRLGLAAFCSLCLVAAPVQAEWSLDSPSWYGQTDKQPGDTAGAFDPLDISLPPTTTGSAPNPSPTAAPSAASVARPHAATA